MLRTKVEHAAYTINGGSWTADTEAFAFQADLGRYPSSPVSYTHLRAHETRGKLVCRLLLEKNKDDKATRESMVVA